MTQFGGGGKVVQADVVSFFDLGRAGDFGVCVVVVVVGCPMSHTLSRWETLDDVFSGIQDLSFHICLKILLVVASTNNPGHPPGILHAKLLHLHRGIHHPASWVPGESRIAGCGVCSACDSGSLRADLWD